MEDRRPASDRAPGDFQLGLEPKRHHPLNDPRRLGALDSYGGTGGLALFTDLRWGRWQVYGRLGWAFPTQWLLDDPDFSGFVGLGVDAF
jgi:hypothetical protein